MIATAAESTWEVPAEVPLKDVEGELCRRMREARGGGECPAPRARMSNLVAFTDRADRVEAISAEVPAIASIHPARFLVVVGEPVEVLPGIQARVAVRGRPAGKGRMAHSEQVTLVADGVDIPRLPFALRGLLVGGLPTNLWWATPQPPSLAGPVFEEIARRSDQVIYDSIGWTDPPRGIASMGVWLDQFERTAGRGPWRIASDLNWRRLKAWRRLMAQALDPATAPGAIDSISEVRIAHGPHATVQAWLLASWMASCLRWTLRGGRTDPNVAYSWQFDAPHGPVRLRIERQAEGPPSIQVARVSCRLDGHPGAVELTQQDGRRVSARPLVDGEPAETAERTVSIVERSTAEMVGRQLSDRDRDPVFRDAMTIAGTLAQTL